VAGDPEADAEREREIEADDDEVETVQGPCPREGGRKRGPTASRRWAQGSGKNVNQAVKLLPHPHPPVAFGLLNVNPEPCMDVT
jgi:hypothetical protein